MMDIGKNPQRYRDDDMGRVPRTFHEQVFPIGSSASQSLGIPRLEERNDNGHAVCGQVHRVACFVDDADLAKVRRFEDGLKLSIHGKIGGYRLHDLDEMV